MNQLTRLNRSLLNDFFGDFATPGYLVKPLHGDPLPASFKVDIKETGNGYALSAEIPGVKKEDIHITVDGGTVSITAEVRQSDEQKQDEKLVRSERYYGSVSRSFQLPVDIDQAQTKASYESGVLTLSLPKKSNAGSQRIQVE